VPLISALYENNPNIGLYTLPLIIYYPMQVMVGTMIVPRLQAFIRNETARLAGTEADESQDDDDAEFDELYEDDADAENGRGFIVEEPAMEGDSCVAIPWARATLEDAPDSEHVSADDEDLPLEELEDVSIESPTEPSHIDLEQ
jgi:hypothetical protein